MSAHHPKYIGLAELSLEHRSHDRGLSRRTKRSPGARNLQAVQFPFWPSSRTLTSTRPLRARQSTAGLVCTTEGLTYRVFRFKKAKAASLKKLANEAKGRD